ncbi:hypothetical protein TWF506_000431 [Arthrobotrys conoides]|uniref:Uncharacterized protein n=1 Tax=Arthrobotrys conoides TaxID=74498 RepID=A0AAN8NVG3_9PEZI
MAGWVDKWFTKRGEQVGFLEGAASDSGAVIDPDETIEEVQYESDFDSDATIPDPNFLNGFLSEDDEDEVGVSGQLDQMLKRESVSQGRDQSVGVSTLRPR